MCKVYHDLLWKVQAHDIQAVGTQLISFVIDQKNYDAGPFGCIKVSLISLLSEHTSIMFASHQSPS